jgi:hypothetical protein
MTTCPRCGRVADDEFVCPACGMSLALARRPKPEGSSGLMDALGFGAADEAGDAPARSDVRAWRLAAVLTVGCLVTAILALVLLRSGGSQHPEVAAPPSTSGSSSAPFAPGGTSAPGSPPTTTAALTSTSLTPSRSASASHTRSHAASPSSPAPATSAVAATRAVRVSKGASDTACGPHCYRVNVALSGFPGGTHRVACWSAHGGLFGSYGTSALTSAKCAFRRPNDTVWVVVDGTYRSNAVVW